MSPERGPLADTPGKFATAVRDGEPVGDPGWQEGRLLVSSRRVVVVGNAGQRTVPFAEIGRLRIRSDVNEAIAGVPAYLSCQAGRDVIMLAPRDVESFMTALFDAMLDRRRILVKHPAVQGGRVPDTDWVTGQTTVDGDVLTLALSAGTYVTVEANDVGTVTRTRRRVGGAERSIVELEHTEDGRSVETHVAGARQTIAALAAFARRGGTTTGAVELTEREREVVTALYAGVHPFDVPDFLDSTVEEVEATFASLAEEGLLEQVRTRREVALLARGRAIAGDAVGDG